MNYYNEIDPKAAAWLRELIKQGHIANGEVDERSIEDVLPKDLKGYTQCHFFAGIGAWSYALRQAGWPDDRPVWTGSCPCQPFSASGKGKGFADERHLWPAFQWLIQQRKPITVFGEQVSGTAGLAWLDLVSTDLEATGYACGAVTFPACSVGAPHMRQRLYWVANSDRQRHAKRKNETGFTGEESPKEGGKALVVGSGTPVTGGGPTNGAWRNTDWLKCTDGKWRAAEPGTFPLAHGATARVGLLRGYGNAIVAPQAQIFIETFLASEADDIRRRKKL